MMISTHGVKECRRVAFGAPFVFGCGLVFATLALAAAATGALAAKKSVPTRPGVTVDVDLIVPDGAKALLLLFDGAGGKLGTGSAGFVQGAKDDFRRNKVAAALVDAPSDQKNFMGGMHPEFRTSEDHVADIDAVVEELRAQTGLPIWISGISLGTRSAAHYAVERADRIDGVVLISSSTNNPRGTPIDQFPLERITVPLLAVAHEHDRCRGTPPSGARRIVAAATKSPDAVAKMFTGGTNSGRQPCGVKTHHTFFGIEGEVAAAVAEFIAKHTR